MKSLKWIIFLSLGILSVSSSVSQFFPTEATEIKTQEETLSPYFFVNSSEETDKLPLLSTRAEVNIAGVIADVVVKQTYKNSGKNPIEAIYIFPGSTRAAVYGMTMKIGQRTIEANIEEREQAKQIYEEAKKEGKTASLLEQQRPNVFQMNVAMIMPGDTITVELRYTEMLIPLDGVYSFVYPTVVGPRYSNKSKKSADENDKYVETPYHKSGENPSYDFDIKFYLNAGMPISKVQSPTHKIKINSTESNIKIIELDKSESKAGNKDFILNYSLSGDKIQTGLILSEQKDEKFFMLMLQPPQKVETQNVSPREYIFVVDVSGSMNGFPISVTKELISRMLRTLKPNERFNIIFFAGRANVLSEVMLSGNTENILKATDMLNQQIGGGGTELITALKKAWSMPKNDKYSRTIVIATDGYIDVERESFDLIRDNLDNTNVFTFGIGSSVNRFLLEGLARIGKGESFVATNLKEADSLAAKFFQYTSNPILSNINIEFDGFNAYDLEPLKIPDVFANRPIIVSGKWKGPITGKITVKGISGKEELVVNIPVNLFATIDNSPALKYLWARERLAILSDYASIDDEKRFKSEIVDLGLKYNLLSNYTSFVAVDTDPRRTDKEMVTVRQPLPMPEGVSDLAIGSSSGWGGALAPRGSRGGEAVSYYLKSNEEVTSEQTPIEKEPSFDSNELLKVLKYPEFAKIAGVEGKVLLRLFISKLGKVIKVNVESSENELLDDAAIDAVNAIKFTPAISNGSPVDAWVSVPINFNLKESKGKHQRKVLTKNRHNIEILDISLGTGRLIASGVKLKVHYVAYITDRDKPIEDTYKKNKYIEFEYGDKSVIKGLEEGIDGMRIGGKRLILLPHDKRFGGIPQFSLPTDKKLVMIVELLE